MLEDIGNLELWDDESAVLFLTGGARYIDFNISKF